MSGSGRNCTAVQRIRRSHVYKLSQSYNFAISSPDDLVHLLLANGTLARTFYWRPWGGTLSNMTPVPNRQGNWTQTANHFWTSYLTLHNYLCSVGKSVFVCTYWCLGLGIEVDPLRLAMRLQPPLSSLLRSHTTRIKPQT